MDQKVKQNEYVDKHRRCGGEANPSNASSQCQPPCPVADTPGLSSRFESTHQPLAAEWIPDQVTRWLCLCKAIPPKLGSWKWWPFTWIWTPKLYMRPSHIHPIGTFKIVPGVVASGIWSVTDGERFTRSHCHSSSRIFSTWMIFLS